MHRQRGFHNPQPMTLRYYDCIEQLTKDLDLLEKNKTVTKHDVIATVRSRLVQLMKHIIVTPMIGAEYAYPGDIDLTPWTDEHTDGSGGAA